MSISANEHLLEQASAIFLKLQEAPEDVGLLTERDAFLAGGEAHREAYFFIAKAYAATSPRRRGKILPTIVVFLVLSLGAYLAGPAAYTYWISDFRTAGSPKEFVLASGDRAHLDATSALSDRTAEGDRNVELIRGAAYFSVNQNARPFTVAIGGLEAKALGTEFEAAWIDEVVSLAVFEGVVEIRGPTGIWTLNAGDRLTWS
ncbi:MAG: FecR domain-containing protein, partial [Pseudomonadota bacterium]